MKREIFAAAVLGLAGLLVAAGRVRGEDLVTLSGTTYRDVQAVRVEPDGVTWRHADGAVKVDFADCPEEVRRAYHYDPAKAAAYRNTQAKARQHADEQARHDVIEHEARQRAQAQAQAANDGEKVMVLRRALSPAASNATRETAARMQADTDQRAAEAAESADPLHLVPAVPGVLGPRPINPTMNTSNSKEFAATLHQSPTGASTNFVPTALDSTRSNLADPFFQPLYMTRSYYEDVDRAAAFARGVPLKQP